MYSLRRNFSTIRQHLQELANNSAYPSEAFVMTFFITEKIIRRTLIHLIVTSGCCTGQALQIMDDVRGFKEIKETWKKYDPNKKSLPNILTNPNWEKLLNFAKDRNKLLHGVDHEGESYYKRQAQDMLSLLDVIRSAFQSEYNYAGWRGMKRRACK